MPSRLLLIPLCGLLVALSTAEPGAAATGAWRETAPMLQGRTNHTATTLPDGRVLVAGGRTASAQTAPAVASAELFTPADERWVPVPAMGAARLDHTATLLTGAPCAAQPVPAWCGSVLVSGFASTAERFVPATARWLPAGTTTARLRHTATALPDGRVLVAGGRDLSGARLASAELYDPHTDGWSSTGEMAEAREWHAASLLPDGRVLVAGGVGETASGLAPALGSAEVWDPGTGAWTALGEADDLGVPRYQLPSVELLDGRPLLVGGTTGTEMRRAADRYDGTTRQGVQALGFARAGHTATRLADGRVLIAGGGTGEQTVAPSEIYAADGATRSTSGLLQVGRHGHSAARTGALVLIAGGTDGRTPRLAAAELFDPAAEPAPGRVTDLAAVADGATGARLTFRSVGADGRAEPPAQRYLIRQSSEPIETLEAFERATPLCDGACAFGPGAVGEVLSLSVAGLSPGSTYHWAIRAQSDPGQVGPLSNSASATTPAVLVPPFPSGIGDLAARALSHRSIALTFSAPGTAGTAEPPPDYAIHQSARPILGEAQFAAARPLCGGRCRLPAGTAGDPVTLTVDDLEPSTTYHYAARPALPGGGLGPFSNLASATTLADRLRPGRVTGLRARARSATAVRLSFRAPGSDGRAGPPATRFDVRRSRRPLTSAARFRAAGRLCRRGGCRLRPRRVGARLGLTITRLCPRTRYYFAVRAIDAAGNAGARSISVRARTRTARRRCSA